MTYCHGDESQKEARQNIDCTEYSACYEVNNMPALQNELGTYLQLKGSEKEGAVNDD